MWDIMAGEGGPKGEAAAKQEVEEIQIQISSINEECDPFSSGKKRDSSPRKYFLNVDQLEHLRKKGYTMGRKIDSGGFAEVYEAFAGRETVACKVIAVPEGAHQKQAERDIVRELNTLRTIKHPHVVKVYAIVTFRDKESNQMTRVCVFMEMAEKGSLLTSIRAQGGLSEAQAHKYFVHVTWALDYLHSKLRTAHRDIKPENILINAKDEAKLSDFGLSAIGVDPNTDKQIDLMSNCGTFLYQAPEVLRNDPYDPFMADVWSLGVTLHFMVTDSYPFGSDDGSLDTQSLLWKYDEISLKFKPTLKLSRHLQDLLRKMLDPVVVARIPLSEILTHPWFTKTKTPDEPMASMSSIEVPESPQEESSLKGFRTFPASESSENMSPHRQLPSPSLSAPSPPSPSPAAKPSPSKSPPQTPGAESVSSSKTTNISPSTVNSKSKSKAHSATPSPEISQNRCCLSIFLSCFCCCCCGPRTSTS